MQPFPKFSQVVPLRNSGMVSLFFTITLTIFLYTSAFSKDGYRLWMQYYSLEFPQQEVKNTFSTIFIGKGGETMEVIKRELTLAYNGFFDEKVPVHTLFTQNPNANLHIELENDSLSKAWGEIGLGDSLNEEGFLIKYHPEKKSLLITAKSEAGLLYGVFRWLQMVQKGEAVPTEGIRSNPKIQYRLLNHWDNLDRTVERGYSGFSIWNWHRLPRHVDQQYHDYARANASIGINGTVVTNVNANARVLTPEYLEKAAALANVFRAYGIKLYLTARFSAPIEIGGLDTADPLEKEVQDWWNNKVKEIYEHIPDFGGFLVKADSEGQPGPHNYGRTQAEGANLLADALSPHGGIVMWRAFVYSQDTPEDRAKQAFNEFKPLDGKFRDNVIIQVKNGAIDFQPREPFHPLFGAMPETPLMMEFQVTMEYLGQDTHLAYLAKMYEEVLQSDTFVKGEGSTVARVVDGSLHGYSFSAMAGVANIGTDRNWTGHHFHQANWFCYGRLAWDPYLDSDTIAEDWLKLTFTTHKNFVKPVKDMMLRSHEMVVNYMTPLGLHHIMAWSHHYGPGPWITDRHRDDWTSTYYHKADQKGVGFDRTESGSNALGQYHPELQKTWGNIDLIPEKYLLWFHHVNWSHTLSSGNSLWDEMALSYQKGVDEANENIDTWENLDIYLDEERHAHVLSFLKIQAEEAIWWRDACLLYFQQFSQMPLPEGVEKPEKELDFYRDIQHRYVPGI
ncbi:alpha-glucuronidase family glycosyl hydrolase [Pleomorphovibrio marinus]|uniref:alpha-glucuronidase family glycosyl hydrolase n=1 Tax=Pleomorphovibrio marinus TaxID=2164132 RepID=UPI002936FE5B|nr:alpha-glucuronidase family glycosyl hydrolase [Pleomorphovibrio marinus]